MADPQEDRRIGGDRRAPRRFLIGWAAAKGLQHLADDHRGGPLTLSHEKSPLYPFPVYTQDPPNDG